MYHILSKSRDNVIGIRVTGYMSAEDYDTLLPFVEKMITRYNTIRVVSDLREFKSVSFWGTLKTLPFAFKYSSHVDRKAVITDQSWIYTWSRVLSPFFKTDVRCFPSSQADKAWEWIEK